MCGSGVECVGVLVLEGQSLDRMLEATNCARCTVIGCICVYAGRPEFV